MKLPMKYHPAVLSAAIAAASSPAFSANEDITSTESNVLGTLEVKGQTYRNTATKTQLDPEETPQAISITTQEELEEKGVESVAQAVRYTSGVNTELRGGAITRFDFYNVRGFESRLYYYDGLQLLFDNNWNLQPQIDIAAVEQVEVFKGPTSTLYGNMSPGGMVNLISKAPKQEDKHSVELSLGSDNKKQAQFDSTGALSDTMNYRVVGLVRKKDGQAVTSKEERVLIAPSIDWRISENTLLNLNMYYQNDPYMGIYNSLPSKGTVYSNINGTLDENTYAGDANWNTFEKEVLLLGYKLNHTINDTWSFLQNARFMDATAYQENTYAYLSETSPALASDERTLSRRAYITDENNKGVTIDNQFSGLFDLGEVEHNILVGLDYLRLKSDVVYKDALAPTIDLYNPNHYQITSANLSFSTSEYDIEKKQIGLYLQDQMRLDQWVFITGGRYDIYKADSILSGTNTKIDQKQFTGRIGTLYEFQNGLSPFVSYAQSFEPVSGKDRNGNIFETSTANQLEAGIKYDRGNTTASLTSYQITKENVLARDPNGTAYDKIQIGEIRSRGIELELKQSITEELKLSAAYTKQDVEVTRDDSGIKGKTPIWTPDQQFSAWLNYTPQKGQLMGASFGTGIRYIGQMQLNAANTNEVPSATLVDLSIGYDLAQLSPQWQGASVQASISNALDETYYSCYDENNCWFGDERSFEVSARYEF